MADSGNPRPRRRPSSSVKTKSGRSIKLHQNVGDRFKARKLARAAAKATYLSTLPKARWQRLLYRMHPKRVAQFWFSREGGIMALKIIGICIVFGFFMTIGLFAYFRKDLPDIKNITGNKLGGSITYYDRTGKVVLWQDYDAVKRIPVEGDQISPYVKNATVAIEDKDFFKHGAFDVRGITRAAVHDVFGGGGSVQGGSTITQQLVKLNEQWTNNRTITRKVKELILAIELEREYSKQDILTGYLNIAPYGGIEYGVESAARDYFHTSAKNLTLAQSAMLAAIPQSPAYYSPYSSAKFNPSATDNLFNKPALLNRQHYILDQMVEQGYITKAQAEAAKKVDVLAQVHPLTPKYQGIKAPYFVLAAKQQLEEKYGATTVQRGGWSVVTTVDLNIQKKADDIVQQNLPAIENAGGDEAATVIEDVPTGQVVALVGGVDFTNKDHGQVNYAASTLLAPGSSIKPFDYATLIDNSNAGAGSVLYDSQGPVVDPATGVGYPCTNKSLPPPDGNGNCIWDDDRRFPGPITIRYALGGSRNVPAVKAMIEAGVTKTVETASKMMDPGSKKGKLAYSCYADEALTKQSKCYPSAAIGDGAYVTLDNLANGDATLGRLGKALPKTFILKITDASGKVVDKWSQSSANAHAKQVVNQQTAYIVNDMLSDPNATYFNYGYKIQHWNGWHFAIKTGTSNFATDYLMTGWSTKYAVASWVGYHTRNQPMHGSSDTLTYNITAPLLEDLHANLKPDNWKKPAGVQSLPAYVVRQHVGFASVEPSPSKDLFPSWYKPRSGASGSQTIDKVSGKLATSCTPSLAKETVNNANANVFSIDQFVSGGTKNSSVVGNDDVHNCNDSPPSVSLTLPSGGTCDTSCTITATPFAGTHPLNDSNYPKFPGTVTIAVNGKTVCSSSNISDGVAVRCNYSPDFSGSGQVTATVTDSVLYSGSDSASLNFTKAPAPSQGGGGNNGTGDNNQGGQITNFTAAKSGLNKTKFTWQGGSGGYDVKVDGQTVCSDLPAGSTSCTASRSDAPKNHTATISDSDGDTQSTTIQ